MSSDTSRRNLHRKRPSCDDHLVHDIYNIPHHHCSRGCQLATGERNLKVCRFSLLQIVSRLENLWALDRQTFRPGPLGSRLLNRSGGPLLLGKGWFVHLGRSRTAGFRRRTAQLLGGRRSRRALLRGGRVYWRSLSLPAFCLDLL